MDYSEEYRSQFDQGALLRTYPGAIGSDDLLRVPHSGRHSQRRQPRSSTFEPLTERTAFEAYRAELPLMDKLRILSGQDCGADVDFEWHQPTMASGQFDDFASDSAVRKFARLVLWHCECLYYQILGQWIGERIGSFKQKWTGQADRRCSIAR